MRNDLATSTAAPRARRPAGWRYHFHSPGIIYLLVTMILVLGAVNGQNNLLFWLFGLSVAGMILSGFLSAAALSGISIERSLPTRATVGEDCSVQYTVRNRSRLSPSLGLLIEELPTPENSRNIGPIRAAAPVVSRKSAVIAIARFRPSARGLLSLDRCRAITTFPFGLMRKSVLFKVPEQLIVWPAATPVDGSAFARIVTTGREGRENTARSNDGEFYALREYAQGDSTRLIAWRSTARLGHVVVRDASSPRSRKAWIILAVVGAESQAVEGAVSLAAGAAERLLSMGFDVGLLSTVGNVIVPTGRSQRHLRAVLDALAVFDPAGEPEAPPPAVREGSERDFRVVIAAQGAEQAQGDMRLVASPAAAPAAQVALHAESPLRWLRMAFKGRGRSGGERA